MKWEMAVSFFPWDTQIFGDLAWQDLVGGQAPLLHHGGVPPGEPWVTARVWGCASISKSGRSRKTTVLFCCFI